MNDLRPLRARTGFTLIEVTMSTAIASVLLISIAGTVMVASKALPSPETEARTSTLDTAHIIDQIAAELQEAVTITRADATGIQFTVADRDNDTNAETIIYDWSGTAGAPLTRKYNAAAPVTVLNGVQQFNLQYVTETVPSDATPPAIEGSEVLFLQQDSSNSGSGAQVAIANTEELAEFFMPTLPADTVSWRITRAMFIASNKKPVSGAFDVWIKPAKSNDGPQGKPTVDFVTINESDLLNNMWHTATFTNAGNLDPTKGVFIGFNVSLGGGTVAMIKIGTGSTNSPQTRCFERKGAWTELLDTDVWLYVYGKVSTPDPAWVAPPPIQKCESISILINTSKSDASAVRSRALTWNKPTMP